MSQGLAKLDWPNDPYLKTYGTKINTTMLKTNARILKPPEPLFPKGVTVEPAFSGRWDLRAKVFLSPNDCPLKFEAFKKNFINLYRGHGGQVENVNPPIIGGVPDEAKALEQGFMAAGNQAKLRPQMLMVILSNRSAEVYNRVKKNADCRWGVMSQCVQGSNVLKNQPQYCSNVLMKFNCKLGGTTCAIKAVRKSFSFIFENTNG